MIGPLAVLGLLVARDQIDPALQKRLDALFALSSLKAANPVYLQAKRTGDFTVTIDGTGTVVAFGKGDALDGRAYHIGFYTDGRLRSFVANDGRFGRVARYGRDDPAAKVFAAASRIIRELTGKSRELEPEFSMTDANGVPGTRFNAYRRVEGRPVSDPTFDIELIGDKEITLLSFGRYATEGGIDAETYGHDRILPMARLSVIAKAQLRKIKLDGGFSFAQYCLQVNRVEISPPIGRDSQSMWLYERRIGIPVYVRSEFAPSEPKGSATVVIVLDARNGTVLDRWGGQGSYGWGRAIPVPEVLEFAGMRGTLAPLPTRSATPPGRRVDLPVGHNVFAARFEPGQGTLWISPGGREPYRAYRPAAALLRRLRASAEPLN